MSKVLVVGGGAAGMFAAIFAAYNGNSGSDHFHKVTIPIEPDL